MRFPYNGSGICFTNGYFILLGLRAKKPFLNTWGFPGGGREKTDNSELDNAIRETKEETGINLSNMDIYVKCIGKKTFIFPFFRWTTFFYFTNYLFEVPYINEFYKVNWINISDILNKEIKCRPLLIFEIKYLKKILSEIYLK